MRTIDYNLKRVHEQVAEQQLGRQNLENKMDNTQEVLEDHLDLINTLNQKLDEAAQLIDKNKLMIIDKLHLFENGVIREL